MCRILPWNIRLKNFLGVLLGDIGWGFGTMLAGRGDSRVWVQMGQKGCYLAKNVSFGPNLAVFGPKIHILVGWCETFGTLIPGNQWGTFFALKTSTGEAPIGRYGRKCAILTWKFGYLGPKVNFFCMAIAILVNMAYHQYTKGYNFPIGTTPIKFPIPSYGSFSGAHPYFWPFRAIPQSLV